MWFKGDKFVAVTWEEATIIWDGVVHCHKAGEWKEMQTTGEAPQLSSNCTAEVIEDKMYLLSSQYLTGNVLHRLDLREWRWDKLAPGGVQPSKFINGQMSIAIGALTSWAHKEHVYCLVGQQRKSEESFCIGEFLGLPNVESIELPSTNQLMCYNTSVNRWEYPEVRGDIPGRKEMPKAVIAGDTVFLFCSASGDLHLLDLGEMTLTLVHGSYKPGMINSAVMS